MGVRITSQTLRVLRTFTDDPMAELYGFDLIDRTRLKSGTVYPILARLERAGWLTSRIEDIDPSKEGRPARRLYILTGEGERAARRELNHALSDLLPAGWTLRPGGHTA